MEELQELTDVQRFYKNSTVFITGVTGFIGKLMLEKVLRALPVKKVFILVRSKKEKGPDTRFKEITASVAFDLVKRNSPDVFDKVVVMEGDCSLPMLGMSEKDQNTFIKEVNVILHVAATTRFDEHIKKATLTNIRGTKELISLAKQIKNLKTFVYTGTGFSNCARKEIKEETYPAKISAERLIAACESLDDDCLKSMTKTLISEWPNTYTFTKQVTEDYINREAKELPICIIRPTIVISTMSEPLTAFCDNIFSLAGFILAVAVGFLKVIYYKQILLDIVPADIVVNACIVAGWQTGETFKADKIETPVYNISSVMDNPISQEEIHEFCAAYGKSIPPLKQESYMLFIRTSCKYNYLFLRFFLHTLLAKIADLLRRIQGKKQIYSEGVARLHKFQESYEYFATHSIYPHVDNTHELLKKMTFQDRQLFNCDITTVNWKQYFEYYVKGMRIYLLNDNMETVPEGRKKYRYVTKVFFATGFLTIVVLYALCKYLLFRAIPYVFGIVLYLLRSSVC